MWRKFIVTMLWKIYLFCILTVCQCYGDIDTLPFESSIGFDVNKLIKALKSEPSFASHGVNYNSVSEVQEVLIRFSQSQTFAPEESQKALLKMKKKLGHGLDPDANRDLTQLIISKGYPVQKFVVQTKDGFLLDLHRIPFGRNHPSGSQHKSIVFLQHGLLSSACDWVMNFANDSLGFILADNGYDVWMGNSRGNTFSRRHISLKPDEDRFWDWSFDEMAKYDTPAFVDFILNKTGQSSLHYVGHSQGTITAFALFASQPEIQKKIRLFVGLAPIISLNYMISPIKYFSFFSDKLLYDVFGRKDFLPNDLIVKLAVDNLCDNTLTQWVCYNILFLASGYDIAQLNRSRIAVYMNHSPAGASTKDMIHYGQWYRSKRFEMYDYGSAAENMKHYGQKTPPAYNASKVTVPALIFTAPNDWLADPKDVEILESTLPNIKAKYNIPQWNHLDFVWGKDAAEQCYSKILEWLPKF